MVIPRKKQKNQFHGYNPNEHKKVGVFLGWSLNSMGFSKQTVGFVWIPRSHPSSPWTNLNHGGNITDQVRPEKTSKSPSWCTWLGESYVSSGISYYSCLVVSNIWILFHFIYGILPPIDFHSHFSRWWNSTTKQIVTGWLPTCNGGASSCRSNTFYQLLWK